MSEERVDSVKTAVDSVVSSETLREQSLRESPPAALDAARSLHTLSRRELVALSTTLLSRLDYAGVLGKSFGGNRDLYTVLGYHKQPDFDQYLAQYEREDIASRLIKFPAAETWKVPPEVKDGDDPKTAKTDTPFAEDWQALVKRLKVWHFLTRIDKLAGIGRFGVLLLGTGKGELSTPVRGKAKLLYLQPFHEGSTTVKSLDSKTTSQRFGLPESYSIDFGTSEEGTSSTSLGNKDVHWSRVVHVAEGLDENSVYGEPRLQAVLNRLGDLQKTVGGSAEAIWLLANRGLQVDLRKGYGLDGEQETALENQIEEYVHGVRRVLQTAGIDINELGGSVVDPSGEVRLLLMLIAGTKEIPLRILLGSERGELASSQDQVNWASTVKARQEQYAEPTILRPLIDWCIAHKVIAEPKSGEYVVDWPVIYTPDDMTKATILKAQTAALKDMQDSIDPWSVVSREEMREQIPWVEGALPKQEEAPPPADRESEDTMGTEQGEGAGSDTTGESQEGDPGSEGELDRDDLEAQGLHQHSHEYVTINSTCPLCGHGQARVYEDHGDLVLCDKCLQTYNPRVETAF